MPVRVVDASALAAVLFDEPEADTLAAVMERSTLVAPQLLEFEVANVCLKKVRAHRDRRDLILAAFEWVNLLQIDFARVDLPEVIELAADERLTAYDACYLWLARALRCELLTLDERLAAVSRR